MSTETVLDENLLMIRDLRVNFYTYEGVVKALDGINLYIKKGECLGLVGETGCGKTVTVRSIMRLIENPGKIVGGEIIYNNRDILKMSEDEVRHLRGSKIGMIFQDPMTFLNPVIKVGAQVAEMLVLHQDFPEAKIENSNKYDQKILKRVLKEKVIDIFKQTRLADAENIYDRYPHELSGGMRQRILISMAIASRPDLIIADEATTALDVTIQAQILELLTILRHELQKTLIIVTHNLGIVAEMCDRVCVLYGGQVFEVTPTKELFLNPIHPYTQGLIRSIPLLHKPVDVLSSIEGVVPNLISPPTGCRFHPRCEIAEDICKAEKPDLVTLENGHMFACAVKERDYLDKIVARV